MRERKKGGGLGCIEVGERGEGLVSRVMREVD